MFEQKRKESTVFRPKVQPKNLDQRKAIKSVPGYIFERPMGDSNFGQGIIQRAPEGKVGVTLSADGDNEHSAEELIVDDLTLSGRFKTELKTDKGSSTEGAHTIADVLIKKYQKDMTRGKNLQDVFGFYERLAHEVKAEEGFQVRNAPISNPSESRFQNSQEYADRTIHLINAHKGTSYPIWQWNVIFKEIVSSYNNAYSRSYQATVGLGTPGKGEGSGIKYGLKRTKHNADDSNLLHYKSETRLIDMEAVQNLDGENMVSTQNMVSLAGVALQEAIAGMKIQLEKMICINNKKWYLDKDMIMKITELDQHMQNGQLSPSDMSLAKYLVMLASIKHRWQNEDGMWARKRFREALYDEAANNTEGSTPQLQQDVMQKREEAGSLLIKWQELGEADFIRLVETLEDLVGLADIGGLLNEKEQAKFIKSVKILRRIGDIVEKGIPQYILDTKLEGEDILKSPLELEIPSAFNKRDSAILPFLFEVASELSCHGVFNQTESMVNLMNLTSQFSECCQCIVMALKRLN